MVLFVVLDTNTTKQLTCLTLGIFVVCKRKTVLASVQYHVSIKPQRRIIKLLPKAHQEAFMPKNLQRASKPNLTFYFIKYLIKWDKLIFPWVLRYPSVVHTLWQAMQNSHNWKEGIDLSLFEDWCRKDEYMWTWHEWDSQQVEGWGPDTREWFIRQVLGTTGHPGEILTY